jgi:hypothetical protein
MKRTANRTALLMALEGLELRRMLSASLTDAGRLIVTGDPTQPNTITVGLSADASSVDVSVNSDPVQSFDATSVTSLAIIGGSGADTITIDQTNNPFNINTKIFGRGGGDSITAGDENDFIGGAAGNDTIDAGNGSNTVKGGAGNDSCDGGSGNDSLYGGKGADSLSGGAGTNLLSGGKGFDDLTAGSGTDTVDGGGGHNDIHGGPGHGFFFGAHGFNNIFQGGGSDTINGDGSNDTVDNSGDGTVTDDNGDEPQLPPPPDKLPPANPPVATAVGTVTGTVTGPDGSVVAGATVCLVTTGPIEQGPEASFAIASRFLATTDANGDFTLDNVPAGDYVAFSAKQGVGAVHTNVIVTANQTTTLALTFQAFSNPTAAGTGSLSGKVTDSSNAAVDGATVMLVRESDGIDTTGTAAGAPDDQGEITGGALKTTTDATGAYSFSTVPVGSFVVVAFKQGTGHGEAQVTITKDQASTANVTISDTPPPVANPGTVTGTVKDSSNAVVADASIGLLPVLPQPMAGAPVGGSNAGGPEDGSGTGDQGDQNESGDDLGGELLHTQTDANGVYTLTNIPAGTYTLVANKPGVGTDHIDNVVVTANQTTTEDVTLAAPVVPPVVKGTVTGTVNKPDNTAAAGAQVILIPNGGIGFGLEIPILDPIDNLSTTTGTDGSFTLDNVPAGQYILLARLDGVGVAKVNVTVTADPNTPLTVTLTALPTPPLPPEPNS